MIIERNLKGTHIENQIWIDSGVYFHEVDVEAYATISVYLCIIFIEPFNLNVNDSAVVCCGIDAVRCTTRCSTDLTNIQCYLCNMKTRPSIKSEFNQCQERIRIKFWIKFNLINHVTLNMQFQNHPSIWKILTTKLCTNNLTWRHSALNRKYSQVLIITTPRWPPNDLGWPQKMMTLISDYKWITALPNFHLLAFSRVWEIGLVTT